MLFFMQAFVANVVNFVSIKENSIFCKGYESLHGKNALLKIGPKHELRTIVCWCLEKDCDSRVFTIETKLVTL